MSSPSLIEVIPLAEKLIPLAQLEGLVVDETNSQFVFETNFYTNTVNVRDFLKCLYASQGTGEIPPLPPEWWMKVWAKYGGF